MRKLFLVLVAAGLSGCATAQTWNDFTGQHRGQAQLNMDAGACQLVMQSVPRTQTPGCYRCGVIDALTTLANQNNAFTSCMQSRGWAPA